MKFRDYTKYEVFKDGKIWSYSHKKWLKPVANKYGYQIVCLSDNEGKQKTYLLHRVIYETFSGEQIPNNLQCNHISEDKTDCSFSNLNLLSPKQNSNWGTRNKRITKANTNGKLSKAVGAFKDGKLVMTFPSKAEAGRNGFDSGSVGRCCRGVKNYKTHKGFEWRYL